MADVAAFITGSTRHDVVLNNLLDYEEYKMEKWRIAGVDKGKMCDRKQKTHGKGGNIYLLSSLPKFPKLPCQ